MTAEQGDPQMAAPETEPVPPEGTTAEPDRTTPEPDAERQETAGAPPEGETGGATETGATPEGEPAGDAPEIAAAAATEAEPEPEPAVWRPPPVPQPEPWTPKSTDLDPTSDRGWEKAAEHELRAIRPEDVEGLIKRDPEFAAAYARATANALPMTEAVAGSAPASNVIELPVPDPEAAVIPSERRWRRAARRARGGLNAAARPFLMLALFGLGVALGWRAYVGMAPSPTAPAPAAATAAAEGATTDVPPQVQSLVAALRADDQAKVQTVVPSQPYRYLAGELSKWGFKSIRGAEALWTYAHGPDTVTEILIGGLTQDGSNLTINLVVHVHDGNITEFR
jgi:hypothetical protein